jgi:hypothetical protein
MTGDTTVLGGLFQRLNQGRSDPYLKLDLVSETYTVTDTGLVRQENPVVTYHAPEVRH